MSLRELQEREKDARRKRSEEINASFKRRLKTAGISILNGLCIIFFFLIFFEVCCLMLGFRF